LKPELGIISIIVMLLILPQSMAAASIDPRRVGVLYTGDPYPGVTPYLSMQEDAFILVTPVQGSREHYAGITMEDIYKSLRVYMPRTYEAYISNYDVMILSDTNRMLFTPDQHYWMYDGVLQEGMGLLMVGGYESFGAGFGYMDWSDSLVERILPVSVPRTGDDWVSGDTQNGMYVTDEGYENEFIASLPYDPLPDYMRTGTDGNLVIEKAGAKILARWHSMRHDDPPCYATWDIEEGRTYAMCHDWTPGGGWAMSRWDYYRDYSVNLMLYLAGRELPSDYLVVHQYSENIHTLAIGKSTLFALVEFVESFGGSGREIDQRITTLEETIFLAKEDYLDHEFEGALAKSRDALVDLEDIEVFALKVKDQALFWVYLIEWLSVSGVSLFAGTILWTLMVRRSLYREVGITRGY
jgi:uncharacterized membrane protein